MSELTRSSGGCLRRRPRGEAEARVSHSCRRTSVASAFAGALAVLRRPMDRWQRTRLINSPIAPAAQRPTMATYSQPIQVVRAGGEGAWKKEEARAGPSGKEASCLASRPNGTAPSRPDLDVPAVV